MTPRARAAAAAVDWAAIRQRVEAAGRAATASGDISPERLRELLDARARALAEPPESPASPEDTLELLTFALADEILAVETRYVMGVLPLKHAAPLPGATAPVWGVTVWRGDLLTALDIRVDLGISVDAPGDLAWVIVLGAEEPAFGLLVSRARDVVRLPRADFGSLSSGEAARRKYLRGIDRDAVLLLDGEELLRTYGSVN